MQKESYRWFSNRKCKYYPCHKGIEEINCLFCFCPLYWFPDCGGSYVLTEEGVKDCSGCLKPHLPVGYDEILAEISARIKTQSARKGSGQKNNPKTGNENTPADMEH
ncbi:cysteine-rich small domain-containing protein [Marispirochaeta sp.]|uniref:cysteine-rich small domain-containing protein n=1 Tax=Marispirochaeta sp. TaxID=2038653 RepID=UPI0029C91143|nr:cysteine-rich small domain-containing protein [Marispirochaeta sp.]